MHIPDNYLSPTTCAAFGVVMIPVWKKSLSKVKSEFSRKQMPLLGIGAAFSFLSMMFNMPLPGGTTGHIIGAALLTILLGPYAGCICITITLGIQALFFGDGGILALGVNCFNMAFVIPFTTHFLYGFIGRISKSNKIKYFAVIISSYISINLAALFAAIELGIQPLLFRDSIGRPLYEPYPLSVTVPAMLIPHLLVVGIIEAVVTMAVYKFIEKTSPAMIYGNSTKFKVKPFYGVILALIVLSPIGLLASGTAFGEWSIEEIKGTVLNNSPLNYVPKGMLEGFKFNGLFSGYRVKGFPEYLGYILSAVIGVTLILIIFKIASFIKKQRNKNAI